MSTLSFVSYKKVTSHDTRFCNTKLTSAFSIAFNNFFFFKVEAMVVVEEVRIWDEI